MKRAVVRGVVGGVHWVHMNPRLDFQVLYFQGTYYIISYTVCTVQYIYVRKVCINND